MQAIGLDYGTTNSLVAVYQSNMHEKSVKKVRKPSGVETNGKYIHSPKRLLNNIGADGSEVVIHCIAECVGNLLNDLKCTLEDNVDVRLALTVPNAFKDNQCNLLKSTVLETFKKHFSNFDSNSVDIIPEPVAAALYYAYCLKKSGTTIDRYQYVVVSDMGGGTTDLAVVKISERDNRLNFKVVATRHHSLLGGDDVDALIADYLVETYGIKGVSGENMLRAAQYLKTKLSVAQANGSQNSVEASLQTPDGVYYKDGEELLMCLDSKTLSGLMQKQVKKHRKGFLGTYKGLVNELYADFRKYLIKEGYDEDQLPNLLNNKVVLLPVGGSSHLKEIREAFFSSFSGSIKFHLNTENQEANYDSVARGAAIYSAYLSGAIEGFCTTIIIENRTMHNISVRYSEDKIYTCVDKTMPDAEYVKDFNPKALSADGKTFKIGTLEFYQGGNGFVDDEDCMLLGKVSIDDDIYTGGRSREDIRISLKMQVVAGRLQGICLTVPGGRHDGSDFVLSNLKLTRNDA